MIRFIGLSVFFLLCSFTHAQKSSNRNVKKIDFSTIFGISNHQAKVEGAGIVIPVADFSYSFQTNIGYNFSKNKLSILTGAGYRVINQILRQQDVMLIYSLDNAIINDDSVISKYDYSINSGFGKLSTTIEILTNTLNDGNDLEEGDILHLNFAAKSRFIILNIPFLLQYNFNRNKKTKFFLNGGINLNLIQKSNISRQQIKLNSSRANGNSIIRIFVNNLFLEEKLKKIKPVIIEMVFTAGIESKISRNFSILGKVDYGYAITPIYKDENIGTYLDSFGLLIGGKFYF